MENPPPPPAAAHSNPVSAPLLSPPLPARPQTRRIVEGAFGRPLESLFLSFEREALASGSIAQVTSQTVAWIGRGLLLALPTDPVWLPAWPLLNGSPLPAS